MRLEGTGHGDGTELIAFMVIVCERAEFKVMPEAVVAQLQLGACCKIARKQGQNAIGAQLEFVEQGNNARQQSSLVLLKALRETGQIAIKQPHDAGLGDLATHGGQKLTGNGRIGVSCNCNRREVRITATVFPNGFLERGFSGTTRSDQGAIDVKEIEALGGVRGGINRHGYFL